MYTGGAIQRNRKSSGKGNCLKNTHRLFTLCTADEKLHVVYKSIYVKLLRTFSLKRLESLHASNGFGDYNLLCGRLHS